MHFVDLLGDLLLRHLVFAVSVIVIPLKLMLLWVAGDRDAQLETVLSMPEDLCYVTFGLILSGLTEDTGPLQIYFAASKHIATDVGLVLTANFGLILVVHKIARSLTRVQFMNWRAAVEVKDANPPADDEPRLFPVSGKADDNVWLLYLHHLVEMLFSLTAQFVLVGIWLYWISNVYSHR